MTPLRDKRLFLLDMDGTIYLDEQLFDGTLDFLAHVKAVGGRAMYLTNNSSKSVNSYVDKLRRLGIAAEKEDFLTSVNATVLYLQKHSHHKIYAFGTESFKSQLREGGLPIVDRLEEDIDCLCMGFDTELTFQKLEDACILLNRGVDFVATNPDWVCPTWYGSVPDCGSVSEMLYRATGRRPRFIGKPQPDMVELAIAKSGFAKEQAILLGDRLYTDIQSGVNAGIDTVLVLSGEATLDDLAASEVKPAYVMENIREFLNNIKE
ncbi:MAG: HAD-IIA family hydrolase [Clostridia bacterium]|nr:HAD-IIA family hydrolase [Clostridia bacterium]